MKILGVKQDSMIEWPGYLSFVVFLAGCNFRCPFCYVPNLVLPENYKKAKEISEKRVLGQIKERAGFIDAVCVTGGEPTINPELSRFLENIKLQDKKLKIRLETNGSNPEMLSLLIKNGRIDSIAMDIKNSKEKYSSTIGLNIGTNNIEESISIIKNSGLDYEFRTTLIPGLHDSKDIRKIAEMLFKDKKKIKLYILQQFRADLPKEKTINPEFMKKGNYPPEELEKIKKEMESTGFFEKVQVRRN